MHTYFKIFASILMLSTTACSKAFKFEKLLEKGTGQDHTLIKEYTETDGYMVFRNDVTGEFVAYNIDKFDKRKHKKLSDYLSVATGANDIVHNLSEQREWRESGYWKYGEDVTTTFSYQTCNMDGDCWTEYGSTTTWVSYPEPIWIDTSGYYYWYEGNGMRFNSAMAAIKDLETLGAVVQQMEQSVVEKSLTLKYGLSQERAEKLAKLNSQFKQISSQRELSDEDRDFFAKQAFGVGYSEYENALKKSVGGDSRGMDALIAKAAASNGASVEQVRQMMNDLTGMIEN